MVQETKETKFSYNLFPNCKDMAKIARTILGQFPMIYDMSNEKLGYGKKVKLTNIQEKEGLEKLIQTQKIVQKEERGKKRGREESTVPSTSRQSKYKEKIGIIVY